jgi:CPA2 family monovalent cation:H+ antiporter-2
VPYVILEMNPDIVKEEREKGQPIFQGDASQEAVLRHLNISEAKVLVIAISDRLASRRITELARRLSHNIYIIVRTRYIKELEVLFSLGADEVIPEEFETSIEIFARVLRKYLIPREEIEQFIAEIRSESYEMLRSLDKKDQHLRHLQMHLPEIDIYPLRIGPDSPVAGKTFGDIALRKSYGVSALAIRRNSETILNPHGETAIEGGT